MSYDWKGYFPYDTPRTEQNIAIDFALDAFIDQDKKFVVIEAGTGVGKSAIGWPGELGSLIFMYWA